MLRYDIENFEKWFKENLTVYMFPYTQNQWFDPKKYDVVINVSDEWYQDIEDKLVENGLKTYWFPMNECKSDIGTNSIYGAMVILLEAERKGKRVYLHCHAGVNRSRTVQAAYYFMRTNTHFEHIGRSCINMMVANCNSRYLPPKAEFETFLINLHKQLHNHMQGGILDWSKLEGCDNDDSKPKKITEQNINEIGDIF